MVKFLDVYEDPNNTDRYNRVMDIINNDREINNIFSNKRNRFSLAQFTYLINVDGEDAGFVNLVYERGDYSFLLLDSGIIEKYRGKGLGTKALKFLQSLDFEDFIIAETKKDNNNSNGSISKVGVQIADSDEFNYYLLQKDRVEEFIDSDGLEKLGKHYQTDKNKINYKNINRYD